MHLVRIGNDWIQTADLWRERQPPNQQYQNQCDQIGQFLHFGQPFKAGDNNYFTQITYIVKQFL